MTIRKINPLLWIGLTGTILIGSSFVVDIYQVSGGDKGMWWTHQEMKLPVEDTGDAFELYIAGKPLRRHLADRTLFVMDKNGNRYPVVPKDVTVRLNNWEKTKAAILTRTTISGFGFGAAVTLLTTGLLLSFRRKENAR